MATIKGRITLNDWTSVYQIETNCKSKKLYDIDEKLYNDYKKVLEQFEQIQDEILTIHAIQSSKR